MGKSRRKKKSRPATPEKSQEKKQEIFALLLLGLALYFLTAVLTFRYDYNLPTAENEGFVNLCGWFGYALAERFIAFLGSASIVLFIFIFFWGISLFMRRTIVGVWPKFFGILAFTLSVAVLFHLHAPLARFGAIAHAGRRPWGLGGMVGHYLEPAVSSAFGHFGTYIIVGIVMAISFLLATDWCFYPLLSAVWKKWQERRERRAEMELLDSGEEEPEEEDSQLTTPRPGPWYSPASWWVRLRSMFQSQVPSTEIVEVLPQPPVKPTTAEVESQNIIKPEKKKSVIATPAEKKDSLVAKLIPKWKKKLEEEEQKAQAKLNIPIILSPKAKDYQLPPLTLLDEPDKPPAGLLAREIKNNAGILERSLKSFTIEAKVVAAEKGPVVTLYELELAAGTKVSKLAALSDDLAIALKAPSVRVVAPLPGKSTVGVEAPNSLREKVRMKELITSQEYNRDLDAIPLFLGKDVGGKCLVDDLASMPHIMIAGSTGSGKSVMINSIICSILMTRSPDDVKLILIDPKMVELQPFQSIPHLLCPVVTNPRKAATILEWACLKMDDRYQVLSSVGVKHISVFNQLGEKEIRKRVGDKFNPEETPTHIPYIVVIIDELADLMLVSAKEVETSITRLAQKSRAVGIHVILATQRPSTDVITGLIKANMPTRIAFKVASKIDSRVVLDANGAEKLLGGGDMLYTPPRSSSIVRSQGTFLADAEIKRITSHLHAVAAPEFNRELVQTSSGQSNQQKDELFEQAVRIILEQQRGSASLLQRALGIGYTRASRLIDLMREAGIVGDFKGSKSSEVLLTLEEWEAQQGVKNP